MPTISFKKEFVIKDKKTLDRLEYALDHPVELGINKKDQDAENNRKKEFKMRRVKYKYYLKKNIEVGEGTFHQFGVSYEEFELGVANFSTAIIEKDDGTIINVPVENVQFIDNPIWDILKK